ncbi:MAG: DUF4230 domain-containing protein [Niabella sp.]
MQQKNGCFIFTFLILAITVAFLAYFLGKKNGTKTIDSIVMNQVLIQQIAELSTLEVQGTASIKSTNITNDGSISDGFKKIFLERTVTIAIPYVAKYGVNLEKQNIHIEERNKQVYIVLPVPELVSFELRMDKADATIRKGFFETADESHFNKVEKKLYSQSRAQLEKNNSYLQQSKDKIKQIITSYYAPMDMKVDIKFTDELKSKIVSPPLQ